MSERKPIGVSSDSDGDIVVVCDDGSVFYWSNRAGKWDKIPPVPGTKAALPRREPGDYGIA